MKTWRSYPRTVLKGEDRAPAPILHLWCSRLAEMLTELMDIVGDAFRAFVLKDMGGLYLDLDIECFQHREHMLHGLDLVLQVRELPSSKEDAVDPNEHMGQLPCTWIPGFVNSTTSIAAVASWIHSGILVPSLGQNMTLHSRQRTLLCSGTSAFCRFSALS